VAALSLAARKQWWKKVLLIRMLSDALLAGVGYLWSSKQIVPLTD
jgi:hypothetical protein